MKVTVYTTQGKSSGRTVELQDSIWAIAPNKTVMYEDVRRYRANQRQGTAKTKERSEVSGSTRKLFRQKGTGGARRGDINSPVLRGGGTVFGPKPHAYSVGMTRKQIQLARKSALSVKAAQDAVRVVETFDFAAPKTKEMLQILANLELLGKKVLVLTPGKTESVYKSGRNIPGVQILEANKPSTYQIMDADVLLIQEGAVEMLESGLLPKFTTPAPVKFSKETIEKPAKGTKGASKPAAKKASASVETPAAAAEAVVTEEVAAKPAKAAEAKPAAKKAAAKKTADSTAAAKPATKKTKKDESESGEEQA